MWIDRIRGETSEEIDALEERIEALVREREPKQPLPPRSGSAIDEPGRVGDA